MEDLILKTLTEKSFHQFGNIIDTNQKPPLKINNGRCLRYNDLADLSFENGSAGISLFQSKQINLPYKFNFMEKHPLGSQAFIPVFGSTFIVIVAPDNYGKPGKPEVFITRSGQGVNYHRNVWHGILTPLEERGLFVVVDWIGSEGNLDTHHYNEWYCIEATYAHRDICRFTFLYNRYLKVSFPSALQA